MSLITDKNHRLLTSACRAMLLLLLAVLATQSVYGRHIKKDTVRFRRSVAETHAIVLSDSALNAIGIDSLLSKIETVHLTLDRINNTLSIGYDTASITRNFAELDSNVDLIDENLSQYNSVLDVKNLQMFQILLTDLQNQVIDWRNQLFKYDKDLQEMAGEMSSFRRDTVLKSLIADSAFRELYKGEIADLKSKWGQAKKGISDNQYGIKQLQSMVSSEYFETIDLQNRIQNMLRKISIKTLGKEYDYLWEANKYQPVENKQATQMARKSYISQRKILHYFFKRNWEDQFWLLVTGLFFLAWVFLNFRKLDKYNKERKLPPRNFTIIKKASVLAMLVVIFNMAPFFNIHPPTAYVGIMEFLLVLTLTAIIPGYWPKNLFIYWLVIGALYIIMSFTGAVLTPNPGFRVALFVLNIISAIVGIAWYRTVQGNTLVFSGMIKVVTVVYIILNSAAAFCNFFGRLSLAKIFSVTAIYGLTQVIGLSIFIHIITEAFQLQTIVYKLKGGMAAKFNFQRIQQLLHRTLIVVSIVIWTIVFSVSLNIYNIVFAGLVDFLTKQRKVGNTSFEIGSILLFFAIIYISNLLQQGVGSLYEKEEHKWDPEVKKNSSRLAMTRLVLIVIGFLIAVAASGLPIDKITIVLGALGVGIGLGLQAIVNNLVSGVILIFEQPFRIGDYIEIADKKGRVLDIGIRSSKLVMEEGAEIIMPNADLLSGRVINWTLRDDNVRIEIPISVDVTQPYNKVEQVITDELFKNEFVIRDPEPEILMVSQSEKAMNLDVLVWINDVHRAQSLKSQLMSNIYKSLAANDIKII